MYYKGVYHLFFQHNPQGNQWGNMSWGHATSKDLVHWKEQPVAIPQTFNDAGESIEDIFSGSAVVDKNNTSGFGTKKNPPMVAIYTSAYTSKHPTLAGIQAQSLAYSLDEGQTWKKYSGNPVLDIGSREFRDPKVFWYAPAKEWRMVVVRALEHKVDIYSSSNLKKWKHLSEFGPAGAVGGAWECPDLFPLAVDGDKNNIKWVMVVNLNPGGIAGGSGGQYFVGDFDGTTFTSDDPGSYTPPTGTVMQDFEDASYDPWTSTGTAFGDAPTSGDLPGQSGVTGYLGDQLANSFHGGDSTTGTSDLSGVRHQPGLPELPGRRRKPSARARHHARLECSLGNGVRGLRGSDLGRRAGPRRATSPTTDPEKGPSATSKRSAATKATS